MTSSLAEPIPWTYTDESGVLMWTWLTEHFVARITGTEVPGDDATGARRVVRSYHWDLSDLMRTNQGLPRLLIDGNATTFDEAEALIREHVGKCYESRLGYRRFAGPLAFTYTLATGERIDVSKFLGSRCTVTVLMADRSERTVSGDFEVHHYRWRLASPDQVLEIVPEHVLRITNRSAVAERAEAIVYSDTYFGVGRLYREEVRPGCTGRPGFTVGTVDHAGAPRCPLHEAGVPEHLLR